MNFGSVLYLTTRKKNGKMKRKDRFPVFDMYSV